MGCNHSSDDYINSFDYDSLGNDPKIKPLTDEDIENIKNSWNAVKNFDELGMLVMIRIFTVHNRIKHIWIFATKLETEAEMRSNSQLRYHAGKIISTLNKIVQSLSPELENNKEELIQLGCKHYHYGVKNQYFMNFQESLLYALEKTIDNKDLLTKKSREAWNRFFLYIAHYLCVGIRKEEKKLNQSNNHNGDI